MKNYIKLGQLSEKKAESLLEIQEASGMQFVSIDDDNDIQMEVKDGESFMTFLFGADDKNKVKTEIKEEPPLDVEINVQIATGVIPQEEGVGQLSPANTASPQASPIGIQTPENENQDNGDLQQLNTNTAHIPFLVDGQNTSLQNCLILFDKDGKGTLHHTGSQEDKLKIIQLMQQQLPQLEAEDNSHSQIKRETTVTYVPLTPPPIKQETVEGMIKKKKPKKKKTKKSKQHHQQHGPYARPQNNTAGYWQNQPPAQP
ncbi:hypothetical protein CAEBREN_09610 [Caenorhabditis brenneri]|uniref:Uncharacterized protein n=1 Tax=Caenorhabditis brenneri TaxID=135651 RepID=G0MTI3_CAEBE|nr:hypothetical protein CAEBREN_09610 [Caenorhabditis brenneri]